MSAPAPPAARGQPLAAAARRRAPARWGPFPRQPCPLERLAPRPIPHACFRTSRSFPAPRPQPPRPPSALIAKAAGTDPGQVEVATSANVSIGLRLGGAALSRDAAAATVALKAAFADVALGFDPKLILISPDAEGADGDGDTPDDDVAFGVGAGAGPSARRLLAPPARRLLARRGRGAGRALAQAPETDVQAPGPGLGAPGEELAAEQERELARRAAWRDAAYAAYTGLSLSSVPVLDHAVKLSCGALRAGEPLPGARRRGALARGGRGRAAREAAAPAAQPSHPTDLAAIGPLNPH